MTTFTLRAYQRVSAPLRTQCKRRLRCATGRTTEKVLHEFSWNFWNGWTLRVYSQNSLPAYVFAYADHVTELCTRVICA